jgi:hypothetical protein
MSLRLENIPIIAAERRESPTLQTLPAVGQSAPSITRRNFLRAALGTGVLAGMWVVGILPPARRAFAEHGTYGYRIKEMPCPTGISWYYNPDSNGSTCDKPCGHSTIFPASCQTDTSKHMHGFHKKNTATPGWRLRPAECGSSSYDGWRWRVNHDCGGCGGSGKTTFRCHDGIRVNSDGSRVNSICKWKIGC